MGDPDLTGLSTWTVNNVFATRMQAGRVVVMGDAAHRHPPSNGLGSNLAWKPALVLKGQAGENLLDSYSEERAPVAKQIDTRADKSTPEFGPIFEAKGMDGAIDQAKIDALTAAAPEGEARGAEERHRVQDLRGRRPRRRDEPALPLGRDRHRRPARAALREEPRAARPAHHLVRRAAWPSAATSSGRAAPSKTTRATERGRGRWATPAASWCGPTITSAGAASGSPPTPRPGSRGR